MAMNRGTLAAWGPLTVSLWAALAPTSSAQEGSEPSASVAVEADGPEAAPEASETAVAPTEAAEPPTEKLPLAGLDNPYAASPAAAPAVESTPMGCFPACRAGFFCSAGRCISACNPLCDAGEVCTAHGTCVARVPATSVEPTQDTPRDASSDEPRHEGFFLRLAAGLGGAASRGQSPTRGEVTASGGAGFYSLDLGGALTDRFILHARLSGHRMADPHVQEEGRDVGRAYGESMSWGLAGVGATYYLMPINLYFTGVLGLARAHTVEHGRTRARSDVGLGFELDVGKEWWVSSQWGLGVALRLMLAGAGQDLRGGGLGLLFSATYN